jgi:hypothetical protein
MDGVRALESAERGIKELYDREASIGEAKGADYGLFIALTYIRGMVQLAKDVQAGDIVDRAALPAPTTEKPEEPDDPEKTVVLRTDQPKRSPAARR